VGNIILMAGQVVRFLALNRDLKHQDGTHADGIPEVYFLSQSCTEPEKLIAI